MTAALDWWREAGVADHFLDAPQDWLAAPEPGARGSGPTVAEAPHQPPPPAIGGPRQDWPATLADFAPWWLAEPSLAPPGARRLAPRGPANPPLMVLVPMPAGDDDEALLSGRAGRMLGGFLAAAGLAADEIYLASALPAHMPLPDWGALAEQGLGAVLAHHVALVAPARLLILGWGGISTLMDHASTHKPADLRSFNHDRGSVPAIAALDLEAMLAKPALKAGLWQRWLDWTGTATT